ncbi:hypothetical protein [Virgibacillus subterraneus]|uniref:hypothetical protein n=1 Tax=Virgibacillus subterraneus TaxID=621109 RepID=UPI000B87299C|nr:hypothetical protein [Virgibacillus subterraneus]
MFDQIRSKDISSSKLNATVFNRIQDVSNPNQREDFAFAIYTKEDVKLLRQSLLSLAVQGNIAKQDPKDEPASVSIKKIEEQKE